MNTTKLFTTLALFCATFTATGCGNDFASEGEAFLATAWSKVTCTLGTSDRCYAETLASPELLHPVVSRCDLQELVDVGDLVPTLDGWFYSCDYDGKPESFDDVLCFYDSNTSVVCYGGSDDWYTEVEPTCALDTFTANAWPAGSCDVDGSVGPTEYDAVFVDPLGPKWLGSARNDQDTFAVVPRCHVPVGDMNAAASPLSCSWDLGKPCCSCDESGILSCVAFDHDYVCPIGTSTSVMACDLPGGGETTDTTDGGGLLLCCQCGPGESEAWCVESLDDTCPAGWNPGPLVCTP